MHQTQYLPQVAGADYVRSDSCDNVAAAARFAFGGVTITVALHSLAYRGAHVTYAVPAGVMASLAADQAALVTQSAAGEQHIALTLDRLQSRRLAASTEPMPGATRIKRYLFGLRSRTVWAQYEFRALPEQLDYGDTGTLSLPDLLINGVRYPGPALTYRRSREFGWVPVIGC